MPDNNLIIPEVKVQELDSIAMILLSMSEYYNLPEPVKLIIDELQVKAESLKGHSWINEAQGLKVVGYNS